MRQNLVINGIDFNKRLDEEKVYLNFFIIGLRWFSEVKIMTEKNPLSLREFLNKRSDQIFGIPKTP